MRVVMPLFDFNCTGITGYQFGTRSLSLEPLAKSDVVKLSLFSEQDIRLIEQQHWALVYNGGAIGGYKSLANLLLMTFRIFSDQRPPFIKYRLCRDNDRLSTRLGSPMTYNYSARKPKVAFDAAQLSQIDQGFGHLQQMDRISTRTHNSLYFLYRAFHADKWIDSFILMMTSLEALFSKDKPGGATEAVSVRVSSLLKSRPQCAKANVEGLYELRSEMTHGRIMVSDDAGDNLKKLEHLEFVTVQCYRELVRQGAYRHYATKKARDTFMGTLNKPP